jgi:hypothetical protein
VTILEAEYRQSHGSYVHFDNHCLLRAALESPSCPPYCIKIFLEKYANEIPVLKDNKILLLHVAMNLLETKSLEPFRNFYKCDSCHKILETSSEYDNDELETTMFFSKDPSHPHWGVSCIDRKLGGSESSLANFTRVRVGKSSKTKNTCL